MAGEEWARRIVQNALGIAVHINDDNSMPGMYDLRIGSKNAPAVAIECVGAVDPTYTETWHVGPAKGPLALPVVGDWIVEIAPTARVKHVKQGLGQFLMKLEARSILNFSHRHWLHPNDDMLFDEMDKLGVIHASCYRTPGTGKVSLTMPGTGGCVDDRGTKLPKWLGDFLRDSRQTDVLSKLQRSGTKNCHAFVIAAFVGVPWEVESYLTGPLDNVPNDPADLPLPVTEAWVVSGFGSKGLHWNGSAWRIVATRGKAIDDAQHVVGA
jgi:hypothetical protein